MKKQVLMGRIEFVDSCNKEFDCKFTARLEKSAAFEYGNGSCVIIEFGAMQNGRTPRSRYIDTRYAKGVISNFENWIREFFRENYMAHTLTIDS